MSEPQRKHDRRDWQQEWNELPWEEILRPENELPEDMQIEIRAIRRRLEKLKR